MKGVTPWTQAQAAIYPAEVDGCLPGGTAGGDNGCDCLTTRERQFRNERSIDEYDSIIGGFL